MRQYLDLLRYVDEKGEEKHSRAVLLTTGEKPRTRSIFGYQNRYDLREGFPLVTTKRMPFRHVAVELLWFLSGSTNNTDLVRQGVKIWDAWADPATGELGPVYGKQWRRNATIAFCPTRDSLTPVPTCRPGDTVQNRSGLLSSGNCLFQSRITLLHTASEIFYRCL